MQITINQAEIELAIKNYVNEKVAIQEGQDISIDLKASRGPEGFTANIDIVPAGQAKQDVAATPTKTRPPKAERVERTTDAEPDPAPETAQEAVEEAPAETATEDAQPSENASDASEEAPATGDKPKSLFAGLGKPKN